jgi:hypothetical protein
MTSDRECVPRYPMAWTGGTHIGKDKRGGVAILSTREIPCAPHDKEV